MKSDFDENSISKSTQEFDLAKLLLNDKVYKSGYLVKQGIRFKTWKSRFFVLVGRQYLNYNKFHFIIQNYRNKTYLLQSKKFLVELTKII